MGIMKNLLLITALVSFGAISTCFGQRQNTEIQVSAILTIHDGKLAEFKKVAAQCLESVKEKDTGTLQYDWYYSKDQTKCVVRERYKNSQAIMEHSGNLGKVLGQLLSIADLSLELYGNPSQELLSAFAGMDITIYDFGQGL